MKSSGEVAEWVYKAEGDYETARLLVNRKSKGAPDNVCFHSQQCAEKYLKGYLTLLRVEFAKTHDLVHLLDVIVNKKGSSGKRVGKKEV